MHATKPILIIIITLLILLHNTNAQSEATSKKSNGFSFSNLKLNPSIAVITICLISAFFVMGCVSVYVRQCAERRLTNDFAEPDYSGSRRRPRRVITRRGLDPTIIDEFPTFLYSDVKGLKLGKGALECAVCLNEFEDDEILRLLPDCSHVFHPDCIDAWLVCHVTCPVCRANLNPKPEETSSSGSLSQHLFARPSGSVLHIIDQEVGPDPQINNLAIDIQISSPQEVINPCQITNLRTPRIKGEFRSHSMGHLVVRPGDDFERFTLRLSEEVRTQLMQTELSRAKSCVTFPRVRSSRKGFKSGNFDRFDREVRSDRWGFTGAPPFFSRGSSTRSSKNEVEGGEMAPKNLFRSVKSPFDRLFGGVEKENDGERSFNR